jgi:hypothetical protein
MFAINRRTVLAGLFAAGVILTIPGPKAECCPFCNGGDGKTLTTVASESSLVLFGKLTNARVDPKDAYAGQTDLEIETVVKSHDILAGRKVITLPRYLPPQPDFKFLVFCDLYKGTLDPYRGEPAKADSVIAGYLKGALAIKDKDPATRLKYFFDYLEDKDPTVSDDAYKEFGFADYKDFRSVAEKLPPETIARWLKDPNMSVARTGLYASILGHCGKAEHAAMLRALLDDPLRRQTAGADGVMAGYVMLRPKEGWTYVSGLMANDKLDFAVRYAALRSARFFHEFRPDVVSKADLTKAVTSLLEQKDIADLAIEDLRKWSQWGMADKILPLYGRESHSASIIRRAILRFALSCPPGENLAVGAFLADRRKDSAKLLEEVQELLNLESPKPAATAGAPAAPATATGPGK